MPATQQVPYAALLRVSSQGQRERATIETQRAEIRRWLITQGADPDADALWFEDEAVSGDTPLTERGGGAALVEAIEAGRVGRAVVTYAIDRTGRDIISYFVLEALCTSRGLSLISVSEGVDTSRQGGELMGGFHALFAREAKRHMLAATQAGTRRSLREGKWLAHRAPYGFRKVGQRLEVDPDAAAAIRMAHRLIVEEGMSGRAAHARLRELGLYPYAHQATFMYALRNPAIAGRAEARRTRMIRHGGRIGVRCLVRVERDCAGQCDRYEHRRRNLVAGEVVCEVHEHRYGGKCDARASLATHHKEQHRKLQRERVHRRVKHPEPPAVRSEPRKDARRVGHLRAKGKRKGEQHRAI